MCSYFSEEREQLQGEIDKLGLDLKLTHSDKTDMSLKYENLVAICHLQSDWINHHPQEHQDLCMCLVTRKDHNYKAAGKLLIQEKEKQSCTIWELQEGLFTNGTGLQIVLWDVSGNPPIKGHLFTCPKPMSNSEQ